MVTLRRYTYDGHAMIEDTDCGEFVYYEDAAAQLDEKGMEIAIKDTLLEQARVETTQLKNEIALTRAKLSDPFNVDNGYPLHEFAAGAVCYYKQGVARLTAANKRLREALERVLSVGQVNGEPGNPDCLFCGFKDREVIKAIAATAPEQEKSK